MTSRGVGGSAKIALIPLVLACAGRARAEEHETSPVDFDISYSAPAGCPDQHEFEEAVRKRTAGFSPTDSASIPKKLDVRLRTTATGARGHLVIVDRSGASSVRDIEAATCAEASDGLALVVSLLFDPASERKAPPIETPAPAKPAPLPPRRPEPRRHPHLALSTSFIAASGEAPRVAPGGELSGALELEGGPSFRFLTRLGVRLTLPTTISNDEGTATFKWWAAFVALCPGLASNGEAVLYAICATVEQGLVNAAGTDTRNPRTSSTSWTGLGPGLVFAWAVLPPLYVLATVDGIFPLGRDRFVIGSEQIHEVPSVAIRAGAGLGVRIW
jgi:hypothetical protein